MRTLVSIAILVISTTALAQQTESFAPRRDSQAIQIANFAIAASGGLGQLNGLADLVENGTITYNWANKDVRGPVRIQEIGATSIRLDASLDVGEHRWFSAAGIGKIEPAAGEARAIPYHCGITLGALTLPVLKLVEAVKDPAYEITYLGSVHEQGRELQHIHIRNDAGSDDAERSVSQLEAADFLVDSGTYLIFRLQDVARSESNMFVSVPHFLEFSDYRLVSGVQMPFAIKESVNGAHTWSLQIEDAKTNTGLSQDALRF